jgi:hypothetical protein
MKWSSTECVFRAEGRGLCFKICHVVWLCSWYMILDANPQFHNVVYYSLNYRMIYLHHSICYGSTAPLDLGLLTFEVSRSHSGTPRSVELLCTNDLPVAETSAWQHTPLTRKRHPCFRLDSNLQYHQGSAHAPRIRPRGHRNRLIAITGGSFSEQNESDPVIMDCELRLRGISWQLVFLSRFYPDFPLRNIYGMLFNIEKMRQ